MKTHDQLLHEVRDAIGNIEHHIANTESAMRHGLGPFDLEGLRIKLHRLRQAERVLDVRQR